MKPAITGPSYNSYWTNVDKCEKDRRIDMYQIQLAEEIKDPSEYSEQWVVYWVRICLAIVGRRGK